MVEATTEVGSIEALTMILQKLNSSDIQKNKYVKTALLKCYAKYQLNKMEDYFNDNFTGWEVDASGTWKIDFPYLFSVHDNDASLRKEENVGRCVRSIRYDENEFKAW